MAPSPSRSRSKRRSSPPNSRKLPSTSSSKPCGGSSETLGVNWQAQAATCPSVPQGRQGRCRATQSMERVFQGHAQRRGGGRRAAALQNAQGELALGRLERDAQAGGRRLARRFAGAKQRDQGAASVGGERGQQQPQLADPLLQAEDLGEPAGRPAAPRQLAVQDRKPAGDGGSTRKRCSAAPNAMSLEDVFEGRHGYCIFMHVMDVKNP